MVFQRLVFRDVGQPVLWLHDMLNRLPRVRKWSAPGVWFIWSLVYLLGYSERGASCCKVSGLIPDSPAPPAQYCDFSVRDFQGGFLLRGIS